MSLGTNLPTMADDVPSPTSPKAPRSPKAHKSTKAHKSPLTTNRGKSEKPEVASTAKRVAFYLSEEAIQRLGIVASIENLDKSELLDQLILETPRIRDWVIQFRPTKSADPVILSTSSSSED